MENPRPEKVAVVEEVREKLASAEAVVFTEYRGLTVRDLQDLRTALRDAGGEYKVYKNTLVRRATAELDIDLGDALSGPTALTFVSTRPDGSPGDAVLVAKAIKAFAKGNPLLVVKGGRLGEQLLDEAGVIALADVAPRDELLARLAGGMAAPMTNFARLLQAVPQKFAYALQALVEAGGAPGAPASADADEPSGGEPAQADADDTVADESAETVADESAETVADESATEEQNEANEEAPAAEAEAAAGDDAGGEATGDAEAAEE
jgi:large subunit ribosomal protein L10